MADKKISALTFASLPLSGTEMVPIVQGGQTLRAPASALKGIQGDPGLSAYQIALNEGFVGTEAEWLESLQGEPGSAGPTGPAGDDGREVELQKSATHIQWRYAGTVPWTNLVALADITGPQGATGANIELQKSATHIQWRVVGAPTWIDLVALADLKGDKGDPGTLTDAGYQVAPVTKVMIGPDGKRFVGRGVQMFDYLFVSQETRTDQRYRAILNPSGKGPGTGISEPTYYAKVSYISSANVEEQIRLARNNGSNILRVGVEAAVQLASVSYVDPADGKTYPSDPEMLDTIIQIAGEYGMVVQLQCSNDLVSTADNVTFLKWLTARYFTQPHVWINPANEPNGVANGGANVADPTAWTNKLQPLVTALREDVTGQPAGTKFRNPVVIDPPSYAYRLDLIASILTSNATFRDDRNLVINIHYYPVAGETDFRGTRLTTDLTRWVNYLPTYCIMIGEAGIDNLGGRLDPNLDPGVPSVNLTQWAQVQSAVTDFLGWCQEQIVAGTLQGVIGHMWYAYVPGLSRHDDNTMRRNDGTWSTWGTIFRDKFLTVRGGALANSGLAPMAQGLIKGRASGAGTGTPQDLTSLQALQIVANLGATRVGDGATGTPIFQAEDTAGTRGASMFVGSAANTSYAGFYNRTAAALVGHIIGNGTTGVTYSTTSDYRLKENIRPLPDGLKAVMAMRPVLANWKAAPGEAAEPMFLAHELQEVAPVAVSGTKDGMAEIDGVAVMATQTVDYGRITPLLVAAVQELAAQVEWLTKKHNR